MAFILSPNMSLPIPGVGTEAGPNYAFDVNSSLTLVDQHDHSPGKGVQITPAGININNTLTFSGNNATNLGNLSFASPGSNSILQSLYVAPGSEPVPINDLFFIDGAGNIIQLTAGGEVNATIASIPGESYAAGTFTWKQGTGSTTPANFDIGGITIRPTIAATSFGVNIIASNSMASLYTLTLPVSQAVSNNAFITTTTSGQLSNVVTVDGSSITINGSNQLVATTQTIPATQTQVNTGTDTVDFVTPATLSGRTNVAVFTSVGGYTWTAPANCTEITVFGCGGGGGGGGGGVGTSSIGGAGGGGGGAQPYPVNISVTPGTQYNLVVGAGGTGGIAGTSSVTTGGNGTQGQPSSFDVVNFYNFGDGGSGGIGGSSPSGGGGGAPNTSPGASGGSGFAGSTTGSTGQSTVVSLGGTGGTLDANGSGGGGGGGGSLSSGAGAGGNNGSPTGANATGNSAGGGGGMGRRVGVGTVGAGGNGGPGVIIIVYHNVSITNTST